MLSRSFQLLFLYTTFNVPLPSGTLKQFRTERGLMSEGTISSLRNCKNSPTSCQNHSLSFWLHFLICYPSPTFLFFPPLLLLTTVFFGCEFQHPTCPKPPTEKWLATRQEEKVKYWFQIESWIVSILEAFLKNFFFMMNSHFPVLSFGFSWRWYMKVLGKTSCYKRRRKGQNIN